MIPTLAAAAFDTTTAFGGVTDEITAAGPLLLSVVGLMVALRIAVRLAKKAAGA